MVTRSFFRSALPLVALLAAPMVARADEPVPAAATKPPSPSPATPAVHHSPVVVAPTSADVTIKAAIEAPDRVKRAAVVYRRGEGAAAQLVAVDFLRSSDSTRQYVATIPAADVKLPSLGYAIELETVDGKTEPSFASRNRLHEVSLIEDADDTHERMLLARAGGRRTTLTASGDYILFGTSPTTITPPNGPPEQVEVRDQYYRFEGAFTYRLFSTVAEFGLRGGIVRGSSPVPGATDRSKFDVGLNYGAPRIRLRATDWLHFDGEFLTSVTEVGYSVGGGGAILLGDIYATHLKLGFEGIEVFGLRGYTQFNVALGKRVSAGTLVEVTNMPHADKAGVRLAGDVRIDLGAGFGLGLRGGYQARAFASGGPSGGLSASYSF